MVAAHKAGWPHGTRCGRLRLGRRRGRARPGAAHGRPAAQARRAAGPRRREPRLRRGPARCGAADLGQGSAFAAFVQPRHVHAARRATRPPDALDLGDDHRRAGGRHRALPVHDHGQGDARLRHQPDRGAAGRHPLRADVDRGLHAGRRAHRARRGDGRTARGRLLGQRGHRRARRFHRGRHRGLRASGAGRPRGPGARRGRDRRGGRDLLGLPRGGRLRRPARVSPRSRPDGRRRHHQAAEDGTRDGREDLVREVARPRSRQPGGQARPCSETSQARAAAASRCGGTRSSRSSRWR